MIVSVIAEKAEILPCEHNKNMVRIKLTIDSLYELLGDVPNQDVIEYLQKRGMYAQN